MTGYQAPSCTCGHREGEHNTARRSLAGALQNGNNGSGYCLRPGCECRQFTEAPRLEGGDPSGS